MANVLIVDDEENLAYSVQLGLKRAGHECRVVHNAESAWEECLRRPPDLA
ncbi:MAG: response regulator, partial [Planctomycetota bacterium]